MKNYLLLLIALLMIADGSAQLLKKGFDKEEYMRLMKVSAQFGDSAYASNLGTPAGYKMIHRSETIGLENKYDLWQTDKGIPVISIRGTTISDVSWLENFYAAMVPAAGEIQLTKADRFVYELATNPRATVHVGWLVGTGFLMKDMRPRIDSLIRSGKKELLIIGHSQGGAIAYLVTAYLNHLKIKGQLPWDFQLKTYCSAGPKPGNLYFAHDYESLTQDGWAYNVVNSADWVPETPVSIQTADDFNDLNPFKNAKGVINKQGFLKRIALNYAYGKLTKYNRKAVRNYKKYLGKYVTKSVKKQLPEFVEPVYSNTNDYVRAGNQITLLADEDYFKVFPQDPKNVFVNHLHPPYLYLLNKYQMKPEIAEENTLNGHWELSYIARQSATFTELYPEKRPFINMNNHNLQFSGSTGCNNFTGLLKRDGNQINFPEAMAMTRMMCPGQGEQAFLSVLKTVNRYSLDKDTLTLISGDVAVMRFTRVWL
jgi:heat shock protein HslJ